MSMYRHVVTPLELKDGTRSRHTRLNSVTWDPTSRELIYLRNEAGLTGLWSCDPATGKRKALTDPYLNVVRYWPVEDPVVRLVLALDPAFTEREQLFLLHHDGTLRAWIEAEDAYHYFGGQLFDGVGFYVSNSASDTRHRIMQADTSTGRTRELFASDAVLTTVMPLSSERLLLLEEQTNIDRRFHVFDTQTGVLTALAAGYGRIGQIRPISGDTVIFAGDLGGERVGLHTLNLDSEAVYTVLERPDQDVLAFCVHPTTGRIAMTLSKECASELVTTTLDAPHVAVALTREPIHVHSMCFLGEDDLLTVTSGPFRPPEAQVHALAKPAEAPDASCATTEAGAETVERFTSFDGREIEYVVIGSPDSGRAMIYLHGGPESMFERSHSPILEQLVDNDVLVIAPNIRGSEGYGRCFIGLDDGNRRTDALADVIALREHVQARHGLDDDKIGIMGHSYGGFMTLMAISHHPGLWACAVDIAGMSHLGNFLKTAPAWRRRLRAMEYGDAATHADFFDDTAPLNKAGEIRCPLLILHGDSDTRVPTTESLAMAEAMAAENRDVELRWIEGEGHFLTRRTSTECAASTIVEFVKARLATPSETPGRPAHSYSIPGAT